jgi:hypothetical protein
MLGLLSPQKKAFNIHWRGSWVDPRTDVDVVKTENLGFQN